MQLHYFLPAFLPGLAVAFSVDAATVSGVVRTDTGEPLAGAVVSVGGQDIFGAGAFTPQAGVVAAVTGTDGRYTVTGIPGQPLLLHALPPPPFSATIWPSTYCMPQGPCAIAPISSSLPFGAQSEFVRDVVVPRSGSIAGRVSDGPGGSSIAGAPVWARVPGSVNAGLRRLVNSGADGRYLLDGLPPGDWRAWVELPGRPSQVWRERDCIGSCGDGSGGDSLALAPAQLRTDVDFPLRRGGTIRGTVREDGGGPLVHPARVTLWRINGAFPVSIATRNVNSQNSEFAFEGLASGSYRAVASSGGVDEIGKHVAQVFNDASCAAGFCASTQIAAIGTELVIAGDAVLQDVEFELEPAGSISGCVRDADTSEALPGIRVSVGRSSGSSIPGLPPPTYYEHGSALTDAQGCYRITHLDETRNRPFGVNTANGRGYQSSLLFPVVTLAFDEDRTGVDEFLQRGAWFVGQIVGRTDGQPIEGALVRVFDSLDREIGALSSVLFPSDGQGQFGTFGLQSGTYRIVVQVDSGANAGSYVLGGPTCVSAVVPCVPPTGGETFTLVSRERRDLGVITLGDRLFANGFEP